MKIDPNGPAFPQPTEDGVSRGLPGLTIRAWMATKVLSGLVAAPNRSGSFDEYALEAVMFADAIIAELNKEKA